MKKIILLMCLIFMFIQLNAQNIDTAQTALRNKVYTTDSINSHLYIFYKNNPFYIGKILNDFNMINIGSSISKGNFIPGQGSTKTTNYSFNTEGKTSLKKINLFGAFNFEKIFEDSTRWAHQTRNTPNPPLYFGSIRYNHYERSIYTFKAVAERNMVNDNLPLSFGIDYRIGSHFSNNDPRGDLSDYQLNTTTTLAYTINRLKTGISFKYGYGREAINIGFSNDNVKTLPYITWRTAGYGISEEYNSLQYTDLQNRKGVDLNFDYELTTHQNLMLKLSYLQEDQNYVRMSSGSASTTANTPLLDYKLKNIEAILFYKFKIHSNNLLLNFGYKNQTGADLYYPNSFQSTTRPDEVIYKYNNYLYDSQRLDLKITQTKINAVKRSLISSFLGSSLTNESKQDGSSGNNVSYERLNLNAGVSYHLTKNKQMFGLGITGIYSTKLADTFIVPQVNEKLFYKYVIYHDYLFNTAKFAGGTFSAEYSIPAYRVMQASLKLNINYVHTIGDFQPLQREILSTPGKDRLFSNISLNLYF